MIRAGTGLSQHRDPARAAREAAGRALAAAGIERASAVFLFATPDHAPRLGEILRAVEEAAGTATIAGCSAAGVLTQDREVESGPAIAVLVAAGPGLEIEAGLLPGIPATREVGLALGHVARRPAPENAHEPAIVIFPFLGSFDAEGFFEGIERSAGFLPIVGAAPSGRDEPAVQLAGGKVAADRTATAIVRSGTHVEVAVAQGCRPIGKPAVVTKVDEQGRILTLASRPAVERLAQALEAGGVGDVNAATHGIFAGLAVDPRKHPLGRGDFLVRPITDIDSETGSVTIGGRASVGQTVVFQLRDRETAVADLAATLDELARRLEARAPRFALYFDCLGRGEGLFGEPDHDVSKIRARFPRLPIAGFFGNGEIAPLAGKNRFHTYTGVLAVFCEP